MQTQCINIINPDPKLISNSDEENLLDYNEKLQNPSKTLMLKESTKFYVKEAYKSLRANLMLTLSKDGCKKIIITSALPNEGKTTNCCNIGITLAQMNSNVLIIDCDLRKPTIHNKFSLPQEPGVSEILKGDSTLEDAIKSTEYSNLKVLCAGKIPANPVELLDSAAMEKLINEAAEQYDYILLDMPPVNLLADVITINDLVDGIVLVIREGSTKHSEFERALASLNFARAKILGIIMNDVNIDRIYGSQYAHKKYGKYY